MTKRRDALLVLLISVALCLGMVGPSTASATPLRIATFEADVRPPLGTPLCYGHVKPAAKILDRLKARGIILLAGDVSSTMSFQHHLACETLCHE